MLKSGWLALKLDKGPHLDKIRCIVRGEFV